MKTNTLRLNSLGAALALVAVASASAADSAGPAMARPTRLLQEDFVAGPLALSEPMHVVVGLKLQNKAELDALISSKGFKPLTGAQFVARYSPSEVQAHAVADFLKQSGFGNVQISPNRIVVSGDAPAGNVQRAFRTSLVSVITHEGRAAYANTKGATVPASLASFVNGVIGLQNVHIPQLMYREVPAGATNAVTSHSPLDFPSIYGAAGLPTAAGVDVGILAEGKLTKTINSLNTFTSQNGLPTVPTRQVGTPNNDIGGTIEWELDSQTIVGAGGGEVGSLVFYLMPNSNSDTGVAEGINLAVTDDTVKLINGSLGVSEVDAKNDGTFAVTDAVLQQAVAQGQTFSFASGDEGASQCFTLHVNSGCWPATSAYVVAVGGTTLDASTGIGATWNSETVWSDAGGDQSAVEPKPGWQTLWSGPNRAVPDIAFDADPDSGEIIVNGGSGITVAAGTSLSSPIFVGFWARVMAGKGNLGFAAPMLYQLPAKDFHDITVGSNGNSAGPGYDLASGRGSLIMSGVYADVGGSGNQPPVASFTVKFRALTVQLTDTSTDPDGSIASRLWSIGDGRTSTKNPLTFRYPAAGTYMVTLTVTDNDGASNSTSQSVTVK